MTDTFEHFDETASEMYAYRLTGMGIPNPDVPYEAHVAMDLLAGLAKAAVVKTAVSDEAPQAQIISFPTRGV